MISAAVQKTVMHGVCSCESLSSFPKATELEIELSRAGGRACEWLTHADWPYKQLPPVPGTTLTPSIPLFAIKLLSPDHFSRLDQLPAHQSTRPFQSSNLPFTNLSRPILHNNTAPQSAVPRPDLPQLSDPAHLSYAQLPGDVRISCPPAARSCISNNTGAIPLWHGIIRLRNGYRQVCPGSPGRLGCPMD